MSLADLFRQLSFLIGLPAVLIAAAGAALIVIARDWRVAIVGYMLISLMLALLLSQILGFPVEWALQQAIVGGLVSVMLYLSARQLRGRAEVRRPPAARWPLMASLTSFRLLAVGLVGVTFFVLRERISIPLLDALFRDALVWLLLISLVGLALHEEPLHAGLCLLTFLGAVELLLFTLTKQRMVVGLWQAMQVLVGLAVAYLVLARGLVAPTSAGQPGSESGGGA